MAQGRKGQGSYALQAQVRGAVRIRRPVGLLETAGWKSLAHLYDCHDRPNDVLRPIHNRMPAMLSNDDAQKWLAVDDEIAHALTLLKPYPPEMMEGYDVSALVSNPRNDSPECVRPIGG